MDKEFYYPKEVSLVCQRILDRHTFGQGKILVLKQVNADEVLKVFAPIFKIEYSLDQLYTNSLEKGL